MKERLIDADKLRKDVLYLPNCYNGFSDNFDKELIVDLIDEQPTVDAEPVIRCKECQFYNTHDHRCVRMNHGFKDDFFCSWGERREDA